MSQVYHFEYDNFDNTTSISVGANKEYTLAEYVYAAKNGLLITQTYGNGDEVEFTYDILGRTKTATYKDIDGNTDRVLTYVYTGDGQLYSIHDSSTGYTYLYTYDNIGRLIASCIKLNTTVLMSTRQEYNANNQLAAQHWTVGTTTYSETYGYNTTDGALTSYNNALGEAVTLNYDSLRRLSSVVGSKYTKSYTYKDVSAENTTTQVSNLAYSGFTNAPSFGYTYDALGNISTYTEDGTAYTYTYDAQNQLTKVTGGGKTYSYIYDDAGNITSANGKSYSYGDSIWRDLLTAYDNQPIAYEGQEFNNGEVTGTVVSGNPTSYYNGTRWTFDWQEGRNLVSATSGSNNYTYTYDSNGTRTSKTVNGVSHNYLYASGKLLRETYGNVTLDFLYDNSGYPYALIYKNGTAAAQTYYYITNLQGDVLRLITETGVTVASYSYDPYGKPLDTPTDGTIAAINPLRYRGYYYDTETGFYYLQSRYYDPSICRFVNADSYTSTGHGILGHNMFAYCGSNPVQKIDINGFSPVEVIDTDGDGEPDCYVYTFVVMHWEQTPNGLTASVVFGVVYIYTGYTSETLDDFYAMAKESGRTSPWSIMIADLSNESNPNMHAYQAHSISEEYHDEIILCMLDHDSYLNTPWKRSFFSLETEWKEHNRYALFSERAQNIDFDNAEEGKGALYYFGKAVKAIFE